MTRIEWRNRIWSEAVEFVRCTPAQRERLLQRAIAGDPGAAVALMAAARRNGYREPQRAGDWQ